MDVVSLWQHGVEYAVATLGTATSATHIQKLLRQPDEVVFCFDGDAAGRKAAWHALEVSLPYLADNKTVRFLFLPPEHDPDSFVREEGKEAFEKRLGDSRPLSEFLLEELKSRTDLGTAEGRSRLAHEAKPLLQKVSAPALRLQLLKALAEAAGMTYEEAAQLTEIRIPRGYGSKPAPLQGAERGAQLAERKPERTLLQCLLSKPGYAKELPAELLDHDSFEGSAILMVAEFCRENPNADGNLVVEHFRETELKVLLESSQAALLDTRFGDEQTGAEFSGAVERLQERQKRKRHDALIAKKERTPQEDAKEKERLRRKKLKEAARAKAAREKDNARKAVNAARAKAAKEKERARLKTAKERQRARKALELQRKRERAAKEKLRLKAAREKQRERERIAREKAKAKELAAREKAKAKELAALEKAKAKEAALLAKQKEKELKAQLKLQAQELLKLRKAGRPRRNGDAERALLLRAEARPEDAEARRTRLKNLIKLGKERGFLTYAEINDHLPDDMVDAEQIESIISTFNDMGIQVYDEAPDADTLLISETAPAGVPDEDAEEEAEAALSTVDPEFGRTTDPVRMYMREMGSVELLTREGEIEIAKRIEDGLKHMIQAISACPTTIAEILDLAGKVTRDEMRIDELVDGLVDPNAKDEPIHELAEDVEPEEEEETEGEDDSAALSATLLQLKEDALARFSKIHRLYEKMKRALVDHGHRSKEYIRVRDHIGNELMNIRFTARIIEKLCDSLRGMVDEVRSHEREIMNLCVNKGGMLRPHFIKEFPGSETNMRWVKNEIAAGRPWSAQLARYDPNT